MDMWHGVFAVSGAVLGVIGKPVFKLMLAGLKKENGSEQNGKAGNQSTIWWLEQNDKIVTRNMLPVVTGLQELKEINSRMAEGILKLVTLAEIKWK